MENSNFIKSEGEIKENDWFCSKWRVENKFFFFVQVKEIKDNGYICNDTGVLYPKDDVMYRAEIKQL